MQCYNIVQQYFSRSKYLIFNLSIIDTHLDIKNIFRPSFIVRNICKFLPKFLSKYRIIFRIPQIFFFFSLLKFIKIHASLKTKKRNNTRIKINILPLLPRIHNFSNDKIKHYKNVQYLIIISTYYRSRLLQL